MTVSGFNLIFVISHHSYPEDPWKAKKMLQFSFCRWRRSQSRHSQKHKRARLAQEECPSPNTISAIDNVSVTERLLSAPSSDEDDLLTSTSLLPIHHSQRIQMPATHSSEQTTGSSTEQRLSPTSEFNTSSSSTKLLSEVIDPAASDVRQDPHSISSLELVTPGM